MRPSDTTLPGPSVVPAALALRTWLRARWRAVAVLVVVNAFVGAMVGAERSILPLVAEQEFGQASKTAVLAFLVGFGLTKAFSNGLAGRLADRFGRKPILVVGWLAGLPVPLILITATEWHTVVLANLLLGVNQGLCWSATVFMKLDLVEPSRRGLAMGLNEAAGYVAVSLSALLAGVLAAAHGLHPAPFYPGLAFAVLGLVLSVVLVGETRLPAAAGAARSAEAPPPHTWLRSVIRQPGQPARPMNRATFSLRQAGLVNNLNDALIWGLGPLLLARFRVPLEQIAVIAAAYPGIWGLTQLASGALSDRWGRKGLIVGGAWLQAAAVALLPLHQSFATWLGASALLGIGTALAYPTLLAAVSDAAAPARRASELGIYRLWRDSGYVVGGLLVGTIADALSLSWPFVAVSSITFLSGFLVLLWMRPPAT